MMIRILILMLVFLLPTPSYADTNKCAVRINNKCYEIPKACKKLYIGSRGATCDGKPIEDFDKSTEKVINITVNGNIGEISDADKVIVTGDVVSVHTGSGDITVTGNITSTAERAVSSGSGAINIKGDVEGGVENGSGDVHAAHIVGAVWSGSGNVCGHE